MEITKDIVYLGVNDHAVDLFESQYSVPNGMAYNSYLIMDDQTVVMDTVDAHFTDEWITKIAAALGDRAPDYLVVQHMEPDHAGSIDAFAQAYPTTKIVSSAKAFVMMQQFFGTDYADRRIVVKEGDTLPLGHHTLHFVTAPMVHWPEVITMQTKSCSALMPSASSAHWTWRKSGCPKPAAISSALWASTACRCRLC